MKLPGISALVILILGAAFAPAGAHAGSNLCRSGQACIYTDSNFVGLLDVKGPGSGLSNVGSALNDKTSSWENKTTRNGAWYEDTNAGGFCRNMNKGTEKASVGWGDDDELTSWKTTSNCSGAQ
ncbi:MAG: peptidase inhibitor family I36 protein [Kineosporiaceae bacterium]